MKVTYVAGAAALCAFAAIAQAPTAAQQLNTLLTANGLKADVSFLASDALEGRGTPSRGLDIAAEYIAAQFRRAGLEPAGDDGYFETANFATVTPNTDGLELSVDTANGPVKAAQASVTLQDPAATDLSHTPAIVIKSDDQAGMSALTQDRVSGKILIIEMAAHRPAPRISFIRIKINCLKKAFHQLKVGAGQAHHKLLSRKKKGSFREKIATNGNFEDWGKLPPEGTHRR